MTTKVSVRSSVSIVCLGVLFHSLCFARPGDFRAELAAAEGLKYENDSVMIRLVDLGNVSVGHNPFSAVIRNKTKEILKIGLDIRTEPGLWFTAWQNQFVFDLRPGVENVIRATYDFLRMTEDARVRIRFGAPSVAAGGGISIRDMIVEKTYLVGRGNPAVDFNLTQFEFHPSEHFDIYSWKGSPASMEIAAIMHERDSGFALISSLLGVSPPGKILLFFFPDAQTKKQQTGHTGDGWALGNMIIEIYNDSIRLDPFHEVTHIIARQLGDPPALFNEGLATYCSEKLGADALKYLGAPRTTIDDAVRTIRRKGEYLPLDTLLSYTDIGPTDSRPEVSYPESASFVKYLFGVYGNEKFRQAYHALENTDDPLVAARNKESFKEIFGTTLEQAEQDWLLKIQ